MDPPEWSTMHGPELEEPRSCHMCPGYVNDHAEDCELARDVPADHYEENR